MQIEVSVRHGQLPPEHHDAVRDRVQKLVHYYDRLTFILVTIDLQHDTNKGVEIIAKCEHKHDHVGHARGADLMSVLGGAMDKVKQQIKHHKERLQDHRRDPAHCGTLGGVPGVNLAAGLGLAPGAAEPGVTS